MAKELKLHRSEPRERMASTGLQRARGMPMLTPFDEIDRLFDELMATPLLRWRPAARMFDQAITPKVDLVEHDDAVVLQAEVPGVDRDNLEISLDENSVTLRGTTASEDETREGEYYRREIKRGEFVRHVALPAAVDTAKAKAKLKDGVLELWMPKLEEARRRKIQIEEA